MVPWNGGKSVTLIYAEGNQELSRREYFCLDDAYLAAMIPDTRNQETMWHIMLKPYFLSLCQAILEDKNYVHSNISNRIKIAWEEEGLCRSFTVEI
jgi:transcription termination factor NusB